LAGKERKMLQTILKERYPKGVVLHDGIPVILRPMVPQDKERLVKFFRQIPEEDRIYLREDVSKEEVIEAWCRELDYERVLPLLAELDGEIVGDATLHQRRYGWMSHIGTIRVVVHPDYRRKELGRILVKELLQIAEQIGLSKLDVGLMETQSAAIKMFEELGFTKIAVYPDHVKDFKGKLHDFVAMVYVTPPWEQR